MRIANIRGGGVTPHAQGFMIHLSGKPPALAIAESGPARGPYGIPAEKQPQRRIATHPVECHQIEMAGRGAKMCQNTHSPSLGENRLESAYCDAAAPIASRDFQNLDYDTT